MVLEVKEMKEQIEKNKNKIMQLSRKKKMYQSAITCLDNGKLNEARKTLLLLSTNYPDDKKVAASFAKLCSMEGRYEEATHILEKQDQKDPAIFSMLTKTYIRLESYDKAYQLYKNLDLEDKRNLNLSKYHHYYRQFKLYMHSFYPDIDTVEIDNHNEEMLQCYDENKAIMHILTQRTNLTKAEGEMSLSAFSNSVNVKDVYHQIEDALNFDKRGGTEFKKLVDQYVFAYPNVSMDGYLHYIKVETIPNTKQIIDMKPVLKPNFIPVSEVKKEEVVVLSRRLRNDRNTFQNRYQRQETVSGN